MLSVSQIFIYPIKSLGGIPLTSALVTDRGFQYDRRWMLVDQNNMFMTQRQMPGLALLQTSITGQGLNVQHRQKGSSLLIPFIPQTHDTVLVQIWKDSCRAQWVSREADEWFSRLLSYPCRLVYMPDDTRRHVDRAYAIDNEITSFSDAYPFLLVGQSSLDDLNSRLDEPLPVNRFRPNIVFTGGEAFEEDGLEHFTINDIHFYGVKPCARCVITTTDQGTAARGTEPLKTLATYRLKDNKIFFGENLLHHGKGMISIGDRIEVRKRNFSRISL